MPILWNHRVRKGETGIMADSISETDNDVDYFLKKAKRVVELTVEGTILHVSPDELYIVWFAKTLGNWKALLSTDKYSGIYWEVTYNGAKKETYVDHYLKKVNNCVPDDIFNG
jgi:hypothetical protein